MLGVSSFYMSISTLKHLLPAPLLRPPRPCAGPVSQFYSAPHNTLAPQVTVHVFQHDVAAIRGYDV